MNTPGQRHLINDGLRGTRSFRIKGDRHEGLLIILIGGTGGDSVVLSYTHHNFKAQGTDVLSIICSVFYGRSSRCVVGSVRKR